MIITMIPEYIHGVGDCCKVKQTDGVVLHTRKLDTVLKEIFENNMLDFSAVRKKFISILKQKTLIPIYITASEIMIPIKVRQPLFKGDCCYGYVNVFAIKKVFQNEILLESGERISFLDLKRAVQKRELMAENLEEKLPELCKNNFSKKSDFVLSDIFEDYILRLLHQVVYKNASLANGSAGGN